MGSIPIRVTEIAKWRNRYTRDAQNVVPARACEFNSRLGYSILQVGTDPTSFHAAGVPGSIPGPATIADGPVLSEAS